MIIGAPRRRSAGGAAGTRRRAPQITVETKTLSDMSSEYLSELIRYL